MFNVKTDVLEREGLLSFYFLFLFLTHVIL